MAKKNIELLKRLRMRFLRMRHKKHFNMTYVAIQTDCGAAMCFAGHTLELAGYKRQPDDYGYFRFYSPAGRLVTDEMGTAQRLLGLTVDEALATNDVIRKQGLFYRFDLKTPKQAAKVIEEIIQQASA